MIIIKTPQPDTEERLVLVSHGDGKRTTERDATPDDLARGGYVRDDDTRAGLREALRARERAELDALAELDEQRARAEKAEGLLIQRETELRLAREDGDERARDLRQAYERAVAAAEKAERELATERYEHGSTLTSRDMIHNKLAQAERERDEAKARGDNMIDVASERANTIDVLRTEIAEASKALLVAGCGSALPLAERVALLVDERAGMRADLRGAKELARVLEVERDTARAELARLTAPGEGSEGEPTDEALGEHYRNAWDASKAMLEMGRRHDAYAALYRLGVAHERARSVTPVSSTPVSSGRATDEELVTIGHAAGKSQAFDGVPEGRGNTWEAWRKECDLAIVRAVAARVRQECLVALAVGMGEGYSVTRRAHGPGWRIRLVGGPGADCTAAEVPATLARLLGEVSR